MPRRTASSRAAPRSPSSSPRTSSCRTSARSERKIKEAYLALWIECHLTKDEILKLYLDRAYMGGGAFGIEAASHYYFGKSVRDVSLPEAAMLAGLFKAPSKYAPTSNLAAARARANQVLTNMVEAGFLSEGQVYGARRNPATPVDRTASQSPDYYLDWAYGQITEIVDEGKLGNDKTFVVKTAHDPAIQKVAENAIEAMLREHGADYNAHQAAMVVMDTDGAVRAMVGGRDYSQSQFNRATDALRQPGSSFKPFVYTTALMNGFTARFGGGRFAHLHQELVPAELWPQLLRAGDADDGADQVDQRHPGQAVAGDRQDRGRRPPHDHRHRPSHGHRDRHQGELGLADRRRGGQPHRDDRRLWRLRVRRLQGAAPCRRRDPQSGTAKCSTASIPAGENPLVIARRSSREMNTMLNSVAENGTGKRALLPGIKVAGKTGTTNSYRDAWFMGFTGNIVAGVWYGNDDYKPTNKMTGGTLPAMTWQQVMAFAHQDLEIRPIPGVAPVRGGQARQQGGGRPPRPRTMPTAPDSPCSGPASCRAGPPRRLSDIGSLFDSAAPAPDDRRLAPRRSAAPAAPSPTAGSLTGGGVSFSGGKWIFR